MKKIPEREAAKAAGERFYTTGKPCKNGHLSKRYTGTGICAACAVKNVRKHQISVPEHPDRILARARGDLHYARGKSCKHGHEDRWFVSNGICVQCSLERCKRWIGARPGYEAKAARRRRAVDPTGHRAEVSRWARKNRKKANETAKRWAARHPELARERGRAYVAMRRTRIASNGGSFTTEDITDLHHKQRGKCAACGKKTTRMEIDHILPVVLGGSSDPFNLQLLCLPCNRSKGRKHPDEWRPTPPLGE